VADTETDTDTETEAAGDQAEGVVAALEHPGHELEKIAEEHLPAGVTEPAPGLLPGEVLPHPSPFKYVAIAGLLVVLTALEVWMSYLTRVSDNVIIVALMVLMVLKFVTVSGWYMHLRTDKPMFRRFFGIGAVAAVSLYLIVLLTLHVFE
jgi:heme/copper-type cytochrome/quinol oxidase subunit 4